MTTNRAQYREARAHYLSPKRRDPVKTLMEEVVSHRIFADAVRRLDLAPGQALRVLDLGSGAGDGLRLLTEAHGELSPIASAHPIEYVGLDADPDMVDIANTLHPGAGVSFQVGDMRDPLPDADFDLYLSCGVPYSHLAAEEVSAVLAGIVRRIVASRRRAAIIVDVLGRYSIEWAPNWHAQRWNYAMTFFEDTSERLEQPMTFFDRISLGEVIAEGTRQGGTQPADVGFTDRSVLVGRHTATKSFNPSIPPYRTLINELARGSSVSPRDLYFDPPTSGAPEEVLRFFTTLATSWNGVLDLASSSGRTAVIESAPALAAELLRCEAQEQRGLGVGHSLTATVIVDAS